MSMRLEHHELHLRPSCEEHPLDRLVAAAVEAPCGIAGIGSWAYTLSSVFQKGAVSPSAYEAFLSRALRRLAPLLRLPALLVLLAPRAAPLPCRRRHERPALGCPSAVVLRAGSANERRPLPPNERRPLTPPQLFSHLRYVIGRPLTRVLSRSKLRRISFPAKTCSIKYVQELLFQQNNVEKNSLKTAHSR